MTDSRTTRLRQTAAGFVPVRCATLPRRWPWALAAAALGASLGAAGVVLLRKVLGVDAADAQDPADLQAVIDAGPPATSSAPT